MRPNVDNCTCIVLIFGGRELRPNESLLSAGLRPTCTVFVLQPAPRALLATTNRTGNFHGGHFSFSIYITNPFPTPLLSSYIYIPCSIYIGNFEYLPVDEPAET